MKERNKPGNNAESKEIMKSSFEHELKRKRKLIYSTKGISMLPMIKENRDLVILVPPSVKPPSKYDVVLYLCRDKRYVLHRVLKKENTVYTICGDNLTSREFGIREEQILGVLTGMIRMGKEVSLNSIGYRLYCFFCVDLFPLKVICVTMRRYLHRAYGLVRRMK